MPVLKNRLIIDLADFHGFEDAAHVAQQVQGHLAGFFAPSNSYVIDLNSPPADYAGLETVMAGVRENSLVLDVSPDLVLRPKQVAFADTDDVARYQQLRTPPSVNCGCISPRCYDGKGMDKLRLDEKKCKYEY